MSKHLVRVGEDYVIVTSEWIGMNVVFAPPGEFAHIYELPPIMEGVGADELIRRLGGPAAAEELAAETTRLATMLGDHREIIRSKLATP